MEILSIGTVVKLKGGERKLMIISRTPLLNDGGKIGYFDYGACLYPNGQINQQSYFFNREDISEIFFEGYCDKLELEYREKYKNEINNINYPKFQVLKEK